MAGKGGMLEKMNIQPSTNFRRGIRFEGLKFTMGDFVLSCAQASSLAGSKQFIGVIAEVEYLPISSLSMARPILEVKILSRMFFNLSDQVPWLRFSPSDALNFLPCFTNPLPCLKKECLQEFVNILSSTMTRLEGYVDGTFYKVPDQYSHFGLADRFSAGHAAVLYVLICKALAK